MATCGDTTGYQTCFRDPFVAQEKHHELLLGDLTRARYLSEDLVARFDGLRKHLENIERIPSSVTLDIISLQWSASELNMTIRDCFNQREAIWRPTAHSALKAQQVFGIPELLGNILENLELKDLLSASHVNRAMAAVVSQTLEPLKSVRLQDSGRSWSTPFPDMRFNPWGDWTKKGTLGLSCSLQGQVSWGTVSVDAPPENFVEVTAMFPQAPKLTVGSVCRNIHICSPPPQRMDVKLSCCNASPPEHSWREPRVELPEPTPVLAIESVTGITVGDLYDATMKYKLEHRLCPYAGEQKMDSDGNIEVNVTFAGKVYLSDENPTLTERRRLWGVAVEAKHELESRSAEVQGSPSLHSFPLPHDDRLAYFEVKKMAFVHGETIPTLAEYRAEKDRYDAALDSRYRPDTSFGGFDFGDFRADFGADGTMVGGRGGDDGASTEDATSNAAGAAEANGGSEDGEGGGVWAGANRGTRDAAADAFDAERADSEWEAGENPATDAVPDASAPSNAGE